MIHQQLDAALQMKNETAQCDRNCCQYCRVGIALFTTECFAELSDVENDSCELMKNNDLFKPMLLTDCCSLLSSILRMQPNAQERCSRIILAHLRDLQSLLSISFIDATVNIGDVGTKHGWGNTILRQFMKSGRFDISFVGRKARESTK